MIRINLLPAELESAPTEINPALPIGAAAILPLFFIVPFHLGQVAAHKKLQGDLQAARGELERFQPILAQVEALEAAKVQLTNRKNVIQQLEAERLRYPQFMDDLVKLLPGNLWLTSVTTVGQPSGNALTVSLDVVALDNYAVADLVSNLETSQIFTDVDLGPLTAAAQAAGGGGQTIGFRVTTVYKKVNGIADATKKS